MDGSSNAATSSADAITIDTNTAELVKRSLNPSNILVTLLPASFDALRSMYNSQQAGWLHAILVVKAILYSLWYHMLV